MRVLSPAFGGIPIHVAYQSKEVTDLSPAPNADCRNATRIGRNLHSKIDHYTPFWDWTGSVFPGHGTDLPVLIVSPRVVSNELKMVCDVAHAQTHQLKMPTSQFGTIAIQRGTLKTTSLRGSSMAPTASLSTAIMV